MSRELAEKGPTSRTYEWRDADGNVTGVDVEATDADPPAPDPRLARLEQDVTAIKRRAGAEAAKAVVDAKAVARAVAGT